MKACAEEGVEGKEEIGEPGGPPLFSASARRKGLEAACFVSVYKC